MTDLNQIGTPNWSTYIAGKEEPSYIKFTYDERREFAAELIKQWCAEKFKTVSTVEVDAFLLRHGLY